MPPYERDSQAGKGKNTSQRSGGRAGGMDTLLRAEKLTQIAFILPAAVLVGWLIGAGLDRWLHTGWIYLAGIVLGVIAGFVQIFRLIGLNSK